MTLTPTRFLALGDSYTIGEAVGADERWPVQLTAALRARGVVIDDPTIVARTGWTTGELMAAIEAAGIVGEYDLVSLQIGVNNQYRGDALDAYRAEFRALLELATGFAGDDPTRVVVLSIPDWGVTPFAEGRDRAQIAGEIEAFNGVNRQESQAAGIHYVDVTPVSRNAAQQPALLAADGLHPSAEMYRAWVGLLLPIVLGVLSP
jgi:lysophospholipase L1-like esterase